MYDPKTSAKLLAEKETLFYRILELAKENIPAAQVLEIDYWRVDLEARREGVHYTTPYR